MAQLELQVNGDEMSFEEPLTIKGLIEALSLTGGPVAVERNGEVVTRALHAETRLVSGDQLEIVHFVGGG